MTRATALRVDRVLLDVAVSDPDEVFAAVARDLAARGLVSDATNVRSALKERERAQSTALAGGIAMPHARIVGLARGVLVIVRLSTPVVFAGAESAPVDLVVVIVSPAEDPGEHVRRLARIARKLQDPGSVARLRAAADEAALRAAFEA